MKKVVVIGSINMDVVNQVKQFPLPGETIHSEGTAYFPGGKGANQAVAAARAGAGCIMIGAVGEDAFGPELIESLENCGVDTQSVIRKTGTSGMAFIAVNDEGENHIILSAGANGQLNEGDIANAAIDWSEVYALLLQNEIKWGATLAAMKLAKEKGVRVFYNPAPAMEIPEDAFGLIDTLVVNETEAAVVTGIAVDGPEQAKEAANFAIARGTGNVIVTLGEKGSVYVSGNGEAIVVPAYRVTAVDTTAAGDTFIGAFAAASAEGQAAAEALRFAAAAAALTVTKQGAQSSIAARADIDAFQKNN